MSSKEITMPDFEEWGLRLINYSTARKVSEALKQAFDQGYALGYRDAAEVHEQWYDAIDADTMEQERLQQGVVQKLDKASGCYVARYTDTGEEVGRRCGGQPFANITIED